MVLTLQSNAGAMTLIMLIEHLYPKRKLNTSPHTHRNKSTIHNNLRHRQRQRPRLLLNNKESNKKDRDFSRSNKNKKPQRQLSLKRRLRESKKKSMSGSNVKDRHLSRSRTSKLNMFTRTSNSMLWKLWSKHRNKQLRRLRQSMKLQEQQLCNQMSSQDLLINLLTKRTKLHTKCN